MNDTQKINKLENERKILLLEYEIAQEQLDKDFGEALRVIDNKLFEFNRIGFRFYTHESVLKTRKKKVNDNKKNTKQLYSNKDTIGSTRYSNDEVGN